MEPTAPAEDRIVRSGAELTDAFVDAHIRPHVPLAPGAPWVRTDGWDNFALDFGTHIVRVPGSAGALRTLRRESRVCARLRVEGLATSRPTVVDASYPFSWHQKIPGTPFLPERYTALDDRQRTDAGGKLARLFAELHAMPPDAARALDVVELPPRRAFSELVDAAQPLLPRDLHTWLASLAPRLADEPATGPRVVGCFDAHPWNLAFDEERGELVGAFDFADVAIGERTLEFMPVCTLSPDLARRAAAAYARLTGIAIDMERVRLELVRCELADLCRNHRPCTDIAVWGRDHHIAQLGRWREMLADSSVLNH